MEIETRRLQHPNLSLVRNWNSHHCCCCQGQNQHWNHENHCCSWSCRWWIQTQRTRKNLGSCPCSCCRYPSLRWRLAQGRDHQNQRFSPTLNQRHCRWRTEQDWSRFRWMVTQSRTRDRFNQGWCQSSHRWSSWQTPPLGCQRNQGPRGCR